MFLIQMPHHWLVIMLTNIVVVIIDPSGWPLPMSTNFRFGLAIRHFQLAWNKRYSIILTLFCGILSYTWPMLQSIIKNEMRHIKRILDADSVLDSTNKFLSISVFGSVYADDDRVVRIYKRVQNEAGATRRVLFLSLVA